MNYSKHVILITYILIAKCIVVGTVTSEAFKDYDYAYHYSHTDGGFFGGSSTIETTSYKAKDLGSDIVAQEAGTLSAEKDVHLKAGKVAAKDLTLESKTGKVKLEAGEEKDFYHHYHKSSGLITTSVDDEGHDRTTQKPVEIAAQTISLPSPAEIDYKAGLGKEFREALSGRTDINWNAVADNYREWSEHTTTLSGPARMLVACVLTVATNGMGSEWFAAHGIAEGTATHAALSAGIQAVTVSAGTSFAGNLGDIGKTFDELTSADFVKNIAATMLTAGISQSLSSSLQLPDKPETFKDALKTNATHGLVRTGVDSAIYGGKVGKNLAQTLTTAAVDAGSAQIAHKIGDEKHSGALNPVAHKAAHGALAVAGAKLTGRDPVGAAIGAAVSEIAAETMDKPGASHEERREIAQKARLIGDTVAFLAGRDVASADSAGKTAVENNSLMHPETSMKIAMTVQDESLTEEERAQKIEAAIEEGKAQDEIYVATMGFAVAPGITSGYYATQSAARWAGTYAGGGMQAVKQEFHDHPIASTVDVVTAGLLGAGFVKSMAKPGLQIMGKQLVTCVYQPTPEQSALSLQRGFTGNKGGNIKANYEIDRRIPRYDRNTEHIVNGRRYGAHAMDQMQNRGIPPSAVENTITTGQKIPAKDGRLQYYDKTNNITVISEPDGDIVTVRYGEK